ncbi:MAG: waaC [Herminiimonas sp.]|nr:waaC [Herminiimonas sp.]
MVRVSSLGDVVHNMPMVSDLHHHFPDAQIDWVVEEAYTDLVQLHSAVHRVIPIALRRWRKSLLSSKTRAEMREFRRSLRQDVYDIVFDTQGLFKTGAVMRMAHLAQNGQRVGLANATEGSGYEALSRVFHTLSIPVGLHTHAVQRARLVAASALGYQIDGPPDFGLRQAPILSAHPAWLPRTPYAAFFHGTAGPSKRWNEKDWVSLGNHVVARGLQIALPWGDPPELEAAKRIANGISGALVLPKLPLMDAVLLVQRARLVVGVDSGLTHIAAAFERPTVEIYCASPRWKTEGDWSSRIVNLGDEGIPPTLDVVSRAVDQLLG